MGLFDIIKNFFSKPTKDKQQGKEQTPTKMADERRVPKKKNKTIVSPSEQTVATGTQKKKTIKAKQPAKAEKSSGNMLFSLGKKGNKRKKSEQIKADPINKEALGFSISLKGENEQSKKRNALRIKVKGLTVHVARLNKQYPVSDISATGLGFEFEKPRVKAGVMLKMDLYLDGTKKASDIMCKVRRHERGSVGCVYIDLDRAQDDIVHEIVLLGQKQQSASKRAHKDREFKIPT